MAPRPRSRSTSRGARLRIRLVLVDALRSHEGLDPGLLSQLRTVIEREGAIHEPILVEETHLVILNGHHRYAALRDLGCLRIPAYVVDYFDPRIELRLWPGAIVEKVTKEEVITRGMSGNLFPPKTTRHVVHFDLPDVAVSLERLRSAPRARARPRRARPSGGAGRAGPRRRSQRRLRHR